MNRFLAALVLLMLYGTAALGQAVPASSQSARSEYKLRDATSTLFTSTSHLRGYEIGTDTTIAVKYDFAYSDTCKCHWASLPRTTRLAIYKVWPLPRVLVMKNELVDGKLAQYQSVDTAAVIPNIVSSINGVKNDGGNINLVAAPGIEITANDADNTITIGSSAVGGDLTDVSATDGYITVTDGDGPSVVVSFNTATADLRYVNENQVGAIVGNMLAANVVDSTKVKPGSIPYSDLAFAGGAPTNGQMIAYQAGDLIWATPGDVQGVTTGNPTYITITGGTGPNPQVDANITGFDNRYVNAGEANSITRSMLATSVVDSTKVATQNIPFSRVKYTGAPPTNGQVLGFEAGDFVWTTGGAIADTMGVLANGGLEVGDSTGTHPQLGIKDGGVEGRHLADNTVPGRKLLFDGVTGAGDSVLYITPAGDLFKVSASVAAGGDLTSVTSGDSYITVTNGAGPDPSITLNLTNTDARYVNANESNSVSSVMLQVGAVGDSLNLANNIVTYRKIKTDNSASNGQMLTHLAGDLHWVTPNAGDVTDVATGDATYITVTNGTGPNPQVSLNLTGTDARYVQEAQSDAIVSGMVAAGAVSDSTDLASGIVPLSKISTASPGTTGQMLVKSGGKLDWATPNVGDLTGISSITTDYLTVTGGTGPTPQVDVNLTGFDGRYVQEAQPDAIVNGMVATGAVSDSTDLAAGIVPYSKVKTDNAASNGQMLTYQAGDFHWATPSVGDITDISTGDATYITLSNPGGPNVQVDANLTGFDARYVQEGQSNSVTNGMINDGAVSDSTDLAATIVPYSKLKTDNSATNGQVLGYQSGDLHWTTTSQGDLTSITTGDATYITIGSGTGPDPSVDLNLTGTDARYVNEAQANSVSNTMLATGAVGDSTKLAASIITGSKWYNRIHADDTSMRVRGATADTIVVGRSTVGVLEQKANTHTITLLGPSGLAGDYTWVWPTSAGNTNQVFTKGASGNQWSSGLNLTTLITSSTTTLGDASADSIVSLGSNRLKYPLVLGGNSQVGALKFKGHGYTTTLNPGRTDLGDGNIAFTLPIWDGDANMVMVNADGTGQLDFAFVDSTHVATASLPYSRLKAANSPTNGQVLGYQAGDLTWTDAGAGSGDVTDVDTNNNTYITVTNPNGPSIKVDLNTTGTDTRYVNEAQADAISNSMVVNQTLTGKKFDLSAIPGSGDYYLRISAADSTLWAAADTTGVAANGGLEVTDSTGVHPQFSIKDGGVSAAMLATGCFTEDKIADGAVTSSKLDFTGAASAADSVIMVDDTGHFWKQAEGAFGGGSGDVTGVSTGDATYITLTTPDGPVPQIDLNLTGTDARYINAGEANSVTDGMVATGAVSDSTDLTSGIIPLSKLKTVTAGTTGQMLIKSGGKLDWATPNVGDVTGVSTGDATYITLTNPGGPAPQIDANLTGFDARYVNLTESSTVNLGALNTSSHTFLGDTSADSVVSKGSTRIRNPLVLGGDGIAGAVKMKNAGNVFTLQASPYMGLQGGDFTLTAPSWIGSQGLPIIAADASGTLDFAALDSLGLASTAVPASRLVADNAPTTGDVLTYQAGDLHYSEMLNVTRGTVTYSDTTTPYRQAFYFDTLDNTYLAQVSAIGSATAVGYECKTDSLVIYAGNNASLVVSYMFYK